MEISKLRKFAQFARKNLIDQVSLKFDQITQENSSFIRESPTGFKSLKADIERFGGDEKGKRELIERVAYTWFNRFCAFRYMDANSYTKIKVVSPLPGHFQPESFAEAKNGLLDSDVEAFLNKERFDGVLAGKISSNDPQQEAYRLLFIASCNAYHRMMPYLFERVSDYSEYLIPDDLLSGNSILSLTVETLTNSICVPSENQSSVEVIGWLYQFYISEKKDEVFDGLKKNKKITPENIPAATQLFTPNWIVRYLVENSLGRLWMLNKPNSRLIDQMEYYIKPEQEETDFLKVTSPEELKVCDPACGSGHMLVYAFELLYAIYEEEGYDAPEIPGLILTNNLYGLELDERAGELAAFALTMKAREKYRRFFRKAVQPNICVLEKVEISTADMDAYMAEIGRDIFTTPLEDTIRQFKDADNFGSLIRPIETDVAGVQKLLSERGVEGNMFLAQTHEQVQKVLRMVEFLSPRYQVVVANPPYMGGKGMNAELAEYAKSAFPNSKSDLFAMFIERNLELVKRKGSVGMITMQSWMFLSSYERLREKLLSNNTILSMAHLGARGFDSIGGEVVQTTAFVLENEHRADYRGAYVRLVDGGNEAEKASMFKVAVA